MQSRTFGPRFVGACLVILSLTIHLGARQAARDLEGRWDGQSSFTDGKTRVLGPGEVYLVFSGGNLLGKGVVSVDERQLGYTVDAAASPKQLTYWDLKRPERKFLTIYKVEGDNLVIAVPVGGGRPTEFTDKGHTVVLLTLKRGVLPATSQVPAW